MRLDWRLHARRHLYCFTTLRRCKKAIQLCLTPSPAPTRGTSGYYLVVLILSARYRITLSSSFQVSTRPRQRLSRTLYGTMTLSLVGSRIERAFCLSACWIVHTPGKA